MSDEVSAPVQNPDAGKAPDLSNLTCGYIVGMKADGSLVFNVMGNAPGLIELQGLHDYAQQRLIIARDMNQGYGVPLLSKQLEAVLATLQQLLDVSKKAASPIVSLR